MPALNHNTRQVVARLADIGLTESAYLEAVRIHPILAVLSPDQAESNIRDTPTRLADLDLTAPDYLIAALKHPQLFPQSSLKSERHIRKPLEALSGVGFAEKEYLKAALENPLLFTPASMSVIINYRFVRQLQKDGILKSEIKIAAAFLKNPELMTRDENDYRLREIFAKKIRLSAASMHEVFDVPRQVVEEELVASLGHDGNIKTIPLLFDDWMKANNREQKFLQSPAGTRRHIQAQHRELISLATNKILTFYTLPCVA